MNTLDYITILVFCVGIIGAGLFFSSTGRNLKSFFGGGGNVPWWISGLSLFMGFFSAGTFVVWGSIAYSSGLVAITIQYTMALSGFIVGLFIAPKWNKTGCLTVAEYITQRFGIQVQKMYTYLFLFISIFATGAFLYPIAKIIEVITPLNLNQSVLILGFISILYVSLGGLRAVVVTDVLQFIILFAAIIIVIPLSFEKIGGVSNLIQNAPDYFFNIFSEEYNWTFIVAFIFYNLFFLGGNWSFVQRYTCVKTKKDARNVGWLFGALYLICPILWMLPPMIYRLYNPSLVGLDNEDAYLLMCKTVMPSGLLGLMLGGMIFATISSLNATLNISAGVFTNDIFKPLFPTLKNASLMKVARISTVVLGALAIIIALMIPVMGGIVNVVISIGALTGVPLYLPMIWTLFSKSLNGKVIVSITIFSLLINMIFKFFTPAIINFSLTRAEEMLVGVLIPILLLLIYEIYYKTFQPHKPIPFVYNMNETMESCDNRSSIRVIGLGAIISGVFISVLGFISISLTKVPIAIGVIILLIGLVTYLRSNSHKYACKK